MYRISFFSVVAVALFVYIRYGKKKFPLLLENDTKEIYIFDTDLSEQNIVKLRDDVEQLLIRKQISHKSITRIMLFIEEIGMLTYENNRGKKITCECSVMIDDDIQIVMRDDGVINDPTNPNNQIISLRCYVFAHLMIHMPNKRNLVTTGYNRNMLRFEK